MILRDNLSILGQSAGTIVRTLMAFALPWTIATPLHAQGHAQPPWHIESFCHRGAPTARRCLIRARQGIIVFQVAELSSAPNVSWNGGMAVLSTGTNASSRQLRFFVPPQKLSEPFSQVRAYDTAHQQVAVYTDGQLHVRPMFATAAGAPRDLAVLALPSDIVANTLQVSLASGSLHALWRDRNGRSQQQALTIKDR